jgi:hypothetical protein
MFSNPKVEKAKVMLAPLLMRFKPGLGQKDAPATLPAQAFVAVPANDSASSNVCVMVPLPTMRLAKSMGEALNFVVVLGVLKSQQWTTVVCALSELRPMAKTASRFNKIFFIMKLLVLEKLLCKSRWYLPRHQVRFVTE